MSRMDFIDFQNLRDFLENSKIQGIQSSYECVDCEQSKSSQTKDLCYCEVNLIGKTVVLRREFGDELGLNFDYLNIFLKDKACRIQIHYIQLGIRNCVL